MILPGGESANDYSVVLIKSLPLSHSVFSFLNGGGGD